MNTTRLTEFSTIRDDRVQVRSPLGLHLRPAAKLVEMASRFAAEILICHDGKVANAKSLLEILLLAAPGGSTVTLESDGPDAEPALEAIRGILSSA